MPVPFLMNAVQFHAHAYYALETIGAGGRRCRSKIFRAIHIERKHLEKGEDIAAFVGANGGDAAKFLAAFKSFSVNTSVARAKKLMADYKVDSVPTLVVQGRWITSPTVAGSQERSLAVVDPSWCSRFAAASRSNPAGADGAAQAAYTQKSWAMSLQDDRPARRLVERHGGVIGLELRIPCRNQPVAEDLLDDAGLQARPVRPSSRPGASRRRHAGAGRRRIALAQPSVSDTPGPAAMQPRRQPRRNRFDCAIAASLQEWTTREPA